MTRAKKDAENLKVCEIIATLLKKTESRFRKAQSESPKKKAILNFKCCAMAYQGIGRGDSRGIKAMSARQPFLFDIPKDSPSRKERLHAFMKENKIWTHSGGKPMEKDGKWIAMLLPKNPKGIPIPYEESFESDEPFEIFAVLDESGFLVDAKTEKKAVETLCANVGIEFKI